MGRPVRPGVRTLMRDFYPDFVQAFRPLGNFYPDSAEAFGKFLAKFYPDFPQGVKGIIGGPGRGPSNTEFGR